SASFVTAKHTVNNRGKLPKSGIVIRKLSFALDALSLSMAAQFLRCRGRSLWFQRCDFGTVESRFSLTAVTQNTLALHH
ncbi:MAG: hypothetical protein MR849_08460, partial [Oscillibacter sp.]|nr:hypothetical protein [Oscillibacter sp.]